MSKLKCPNCKEMREASWFHSSKLGAKSKNYWCRSCVNTKRNENAYKDEKFRRNSSACDSKLADKALANEIKEVWESNQGRKPIWEME